MLGVLSQSALPAHGVIPALQAGSSALDRREPRTAGTLVETESRAYLQYRLPALMCLAQRHWWMTRMIRCSCWPNWPMTRI